MDGLGAALGIFKNGISYSLDQSQVDSLNMLKVLKSLLRIWCSSFYYVSLINLDYLIKYLQNPE